LRRAQAVKLPKAQHVSSYRSAHCAGHDHDDTGALTRIQSVVIFGSIGGGLIACALGSFIYDIWQVVGR
jgi:hypothetical protein